MYIFDIKRYSINDGPGIRITFFLKGCPLRCVWCHNPEGVSFEQTKLYTINRCIACRLCVKSCPAKALKSVKGKGIVTNFDRCILCGKCAEVCPSTAMQMVRREISTSEIIAEIEKERPFFEKDGGVTFCGGEPLMQKDALIEALDACGERGIHRVVDTTLYASAETVLQVASRTDLFLVDLKLMDNHLHKKYCGVENTQILSNICLISEMNIPYIIRIPIIEGINADEANITSSALFLSSLPNVPSVELLPYHDIAIGKHVRLGTIYNPLDYQMDIPSQAKIEKVISIFAEYGIKASV